MKQFTVRIVNRENPEDFEEVGKRHEGRIADFVELMWTRINDRYKIVVLDENGNETNKY